MLSFLSKSSKSVVSLTLGTFKFARAVSKCSQPAVACGPGMDHAALEPLALLGTPDRGPMRIRLMGPGVTLPFHGVTLPFPGSLPLRQVGESLLVRAVQELTAFAAPLLRAVGGLKAGSQHKSHPQSKWDGDGGPGRPREPGLGAAPMPGHV